VKDYPESLLRDIVASFQDAVVEVLVRKTLQAAQDQGLKKIVISGGWEPIVVFAKK